MSTSSGIVASAELAAAYATAIDSRGTRFMLIGIQNESLTLKGTIPSSGETLEDDLPLLQDALEDSVPAYVLARLNEEDVAWLFICYVPETSTVRNKMLYASTRSSLTKELGDQRFKDSLFATTKSDLTPEAYAAHLKHVSAPSPLSAREAEIASIRAAEGSTYVSSKTRASHIHVAAHRVETQWSVEMVEALQALGVGDPSFNLIVAGIDLATEGVELKDKATATIDELKSILPESDPSYAFYAWEHEVEGIARRDIIFIYACPSSSPVKSRMLYSAMVRSLIQMASDNYGVTVVKKVETSDPADLDLSWVKSELSPNATPVVVEEKAFARPKGPARRPR